MGESMAKARVFTSGSSQFVRLPKGFEMDFGAVEIFREGDLIVLREKRPAPAAVRRTRRQRFARYRGEKFYPGPNDL
jgi:virulence-associated protein VagC